MKTKYIRVGSKAEKVAMARAEQRRKNATEVAEAAALGLNVAAFARQNNGMWEIKHDRPYEFYPTWSGGPHLHTASPGRFELTFTMPATPSASAFVSSLMALFRG